MKGGGKMLRSAIGGVCVRCVCVYADNIFVFLRLQRYVFFSMRPNYLR